MLAGKELAEGLKTAGSPAILSTEESITMKFVQSISKFVNEENGVTAIEYGLIAALIAVVIIASVQLVGTNLRAVFTKVAGCLVAGAVC